MRRRLCAAILTFEAVVLGLTTPVLISVQEVDKAVALWTGLGLAVGCLLTAGLLRRPWAFGLGWLVQAAAVLLGLQVTAMLVLGVVFLALWIGAYVLGGRIDEHQAQVARVAAEDERAVEQPVVAPEHWQHELVCGRDTFRPHARSGALDLLRPAAVALPAVCLVVGVLVLLLSDGNGLVGGLLVVLALAWPAVSWLAQRQAWKSFLRAGRTYRTSFTDDALVLESDGHLLSVDYDDIEALSVEHGLVSARLRDGGQQLQLPEEVFPPAAQARVRDHLGARPADDGRDANP